MEINEEAVLNWHSHPITKALKLSLTQAFIDDIAKANPECLDYADTIIGEVQTFMMEELGDET